MARRRWWLTGLFLLAIGPSAFAAEASAVAMSLFAVEIRTGPAWQADKAAAEQHHFTEHSAHLRRLREAGHLRLGARYGDVGLLVLQAEDEAAAHLMLAPDPSIKAGVFRYTLAPMRVFYGGTL